MTADSSQASSVSGTCVIRRHSGDSYWSLEGGVCGGVGGYKGRGGSP